MTPGARIVRKVGAVRRRRLLWGATASAAYAVAAFSLGLAVTGLAASAWRPGARFILVGGILAATAAAFLAARSTWRRLGPRVSPAEAARLLAGGEGEEADLLLVGADLARWGEAGTKERGASATLVAAEIERAEQSARTLRVGRAAPAAAALKGLFFALFAAGTFAAFLLHGPVGYRSVWTEVPRPRAAPGVKVGDLVVTVSPPAYTGLSAVTDEGAQGDVRAYPGSRVTLSGHLSADVDAGLWEGPGEEYVNLALAGRDFTVSFVVKEAGSYRFSFLRMKKTVRSDFAPRSIALIADAKPEIDLVLPERDMELSGSEEVEVRFTARDDFSVEGARVVLQGAEEVSLPVRFRPGPEVRGEVRFLPLAHPRIGDGAYLRVEVWDNDTVGGPKVAGSRSVYLSILSKRRLQAEIEDYEARLFEALLSYLGDHLENRGYGEEEKSRLDQTGKDLVTLIDAVTEKAAKGQEEGFLGVLAVARIGPPLTAAVARFAEEGAPAAPALVAELERDILFLDDAMRDLRMDQVLTLGDDLGSLERDLIDRLARGEDARLLLRAVDEIERLLNEMGQKLASNEGELPDSFANSDAAREMPKDEIGEMLKELREALKSGDRDKAAEVAEKLLKTLNEWMDKLDKAAGKSMEEADSPLKREMEEILDQVGKGLAEQERLLEETRKVGESASKRAMESFRQEQDDFYARQEDRIREAERRLREIDLLAPTDKPLSIRPEPADAPDPEALDALAKKRDDASGALKEARQSLRTNLPVTMEKARFAQGLIRTYGDETAALLESEPLGRDKARRSAAAGAGRAGEVADEIAALLDSRKEHLEAGEKMRLGEFEAGEEKIGDDAEELSRRLGELAKKTPFVGEGLGKAAGEASKEARGAGGKLGQGDPFDALPGQRRVMEKLSEVAQGLDQARREMGQKPGGGKGQSQGRGRRGGTEVDRSPVEIPAETEAREWRAFREEVMRAMRERNYPKEYEKEVERYYERLIR